MSCVFRLVQYGSDRGVVPAAPFRYNAARQRPARQVFREILRRFINLFFRKYFRDSRQADPIQEHLEYPTHDGRGFIVYNPFVLIIRAFAITVYGPVGCGKALTVFDLVRRFQLSAGVCKLKLRTLMKARIYAINCGII